MVRGLTGGPRERGVDPPSDQLWCEAATRHWKSDNVVMDDGDDIVDDQ